MTVEEIFDKIKSMISEELSVDESKVNMDAKFKEDLGADSLDAVELIMRVEEEFEITVSDDLLGNLKSVSDIVNYIKDNK